MEASLWAQDRVLLGVLREGPPPALCLLVGDSLCAGVTNAHSNLPFFSLSGSFKDTLRIEPESTLISYDLMLILNYNSRNSASKSYFFKKMIVIKNNGFYHDIFIHAYQVYPSVMFTPFIFSCLVLHSCWPHPDL